MICVSAKVAKVAKPATPLLLAFSMKASLRKQVEDHLRHDWDGARFPPALAQRIIMANCQRTLCILANRAGDFSNYFWPGVLDRVLSVSHSLALRDTKAI
jgi:hypothetical protein